MKIELFTQEGRLGILDTRFVLVTTLESLQKEKGRSYLDYWLNWADEFETLQVPIWILTLHPSKVFSDPDIHLSSLHFGTCPLSTFRKLGSCQKKNVFGKEYPVISPSIYLFYQNRMIYKRSRTNNKFIGEAYLAALDVRYKVFVSNFKKKLTSKKEFDSI